MNRVTGKILVEETGAGVPDLLVTVYDIDRKTLGGTVSAVLKTSAIPTVTDVWESLQGDRLGSVLTGQNGSFLLEYEGADFEKSDGEKRPDLMLYVTAPETAGSKQCAPVLHVSCGVRQNAGRVETYLIKLSGEHLRAAGVPVPETPLSRRPATDTGDLLLKMKRASEQPEVKKGSQPFLDRLRVAAEERKKAGVGQMPPQSFRANLPMPALTVSDGDSATISMAGVEYKREPEVNTVAFAFDPEARALRFTVPYSPVRLQTEGPAQSDLYQFYYRRRRSVPES